MKRLTLMMLVSILCIAASAQNLEETENQRTGYISASDGWYAHFNSVDGVLYATDTNNDGYFWILVKYPADREGTTYTVDARCRRIARGAFQGARNLQYINIPENVMFIGDNAFEGCSALRGINFGSAVSAIGTAPTKSEPSQTNAVEMARYNLEGKPCSPQDKGIQIVVFSDFSTQTVVVE